MLVHEIMTGDVITASPEESVARAARRMEEMRVGGLPVVDSDGALVGILTSRDVRRAHPNRLVADAMTRRVLTVVPSAFVWEANEIIRSSEVERLPVADGHRLVGIVSKAQLAATIGRLTDDLTGLPTASYLRYMAERKILAGEEICFIFFDLNDFGTLNRRLGHAWGDICLQDVATILRHACDDSTDFPCRYGGDEFAVLTLRSAQEALQIARDLIQSVAMSGTGVTLSAGIVGGRRRKARVDEVTATIESLITMASRASTEAKHSRDGALYLDLPSA